MENSLVLTFPCRYLSPRRRHSRTPSPPQGRARSRSNSEPPPSLQRESRESLWVELPGRETPSLGRRSRESSQAESPERGTPVIEPPHVNDTAPTMPGVPGLIGASDMPVAPIAPCSLPDGRALDEPEPFHRSTGTTSTTTPNLDSLAPLIRHTPRPVGRMKRFGRGCKKLARTLCCVSPR